MVAGRGVSLAEARVGQCGGGLGMPVGSGVGVLLWEASPSPLQQGPSSSDAALPTRVGVVGDAREAGLPSLEQRENTFLFGSTLKRQLIYQSF